MDSEKKKEITISTPLHSNKEMGYNKESRLIFPTVLFWLPLAWKSRSNGGSRAVCCRTSVRFQRTDSGSPCNERRSCMERKRKEKRTKEKRTKMKNELSQCRSCHANYKVVMAWKQTSKLMHHVALSGTQEHIANEQIWKGDGLSVWWSEGKIEGIQMRRHLEWIRKIHI